MIFDIKKMTLKTQNPRAKGGFFSESAIRFFKPPNLQKNIPKNYPELEI